MIRNRPSSLLQQLIVASSLILPWTLLLLALDQLPLLTDQLDRGQTIGRDAFNFWMAGKLAFDGQVSQIYDNAEFVKAVQGVLGQEAGLHVFPYPPTALLFVAAFGWAPYWLALLFWSIAGLVTFFFATTSWRSDHRLLALFLMAPIILCNIILGQNGLLTAALFIGGLRLAKSHPILAGIMIGSIAFKPTLAILLPLALLLERCWLTIASAAATLIVLCVLPTLLWGPGIWHDYMQQAVPFQQQLLEHGTGLAQLMKLTSFMSMSLLGFSNDIAYQVQIGFALIALGLVTRYALYRRIKGGFDGLDITILASATLIMLPYSHFYDMTLLIGGLLLICKEHSLNDESLIVRSGMFGTLWALPIVGLLLNIIGLPVAPLILLCGLALLCYTPHR
ncbi:glycosyltransferase family 87 protein [Paraperlucidibaca sp.]|jgi:alpha-1,2-mannosyltransferase|uniref:glycosyltransferase family 87 protein n=1 Tax=Paraperlucidibaca sp. TaxID=2708021 RepID=UPI0030F40C97